MHDKNNMKKMSATTCDVSFGCPLDCGHFVVPVCKSQLTEMAKPMEPQEKPLKEQHLSSNKKLLGWIRLALLVTRHLTTSNNM